METMMERTPAEVFSPGELIRDEIEARGWSQIELAEVLGRPGRLISELIAGKRAITPETAKALGQAFGTGGAVLAQHGELVSTLESEGRWKQRCRSTRQALRDGSCKGDDTPFLDSANGQHRRIGKKCLQFLRQTPPRCTHTAVGTCSPQILVLRGDNGS